MPLQWPRPSHVAIVQAESAQFVPEGFGVSTHAVGEHAAVTHGLLATHVAGVQLGELSLPESVTTSTTVASLAASGGSQTESPSSSGHVTTSLGGVAV